jgi:hypothetical protein
MDNAEKMTCLICGEIFTNNDNLAEHIKKHKLGEGLKRDHGKLEWDKFLWAEAEQVMEVMQFGAKKYAWYNFSKVENAHERYFSAAIRHLLEYKYGRRTDGESLKKTLAHAVCDLMFLMHLDNNNPNGPSDGN